jgi:hypothetical protein
MGGGFTRPSVHQRSEALKEPFDGLGVFKRGTQWATIQDFVCSPSETGSEGQTIYGSLPKKSAPRGGVLHWQDMSTMSTATAFTNMKAGSVN